MGNQFKVGDLAITLIDLPPVMAGSVVELLERIEVGDVLVHPGGRWMATESGWVCAHEAMPGGAGYADNALMPLRGDFEPEQQKQREAEPCA